MEEYYYNRLHKDEQDVYYAVLKGLKNIDNEFLIPYCEMSRLNDIFFQLRLDHPEIFWASGFSCKYYKDSPNLIFVPEYIFERDKIWVHQKAMQARVQKLVRPMEKMTPIEKEMYVHDFICENVHYDKLKKSYSHEIIGPLGQGVGVCEGIAKSVKILLDAAKVWNIIVLCGNNPEKGIKYRHVWNVVKIDGTYYHMDATFDNTLTAYHPDEEFRYDYFNLSDKQIFRDHEPLLTKAPACGDGDHFYYKEKKMSFTKMEDVYKRSLQAAKKKKCLTFNWRGGYFTREIFQEMLEQIEKAGKEKDLSPRISVNFPQAVIRVLYEAPDRQEEVVMEESNIAEKYDA